jgi:hypothetical protein
MSGWSYEYHNNDFPSLAEASYQQTWSNGDGRWRDPPRRRGGAASSWAHSPPADGRGGFGQGSRGRSQRRGRSPSRGWRSPRSSARPAVPRAAPWGYSQAQWHDYTAERAARWDAHKASPDGKKTKASGTLVHRKAVLGRAVVRRDNALAAYARAAASLAFYNTDVDERILAVRAAEADLAAATAAAAAASPAAPVASQQADGSSDEAFQDCAANMSVTDRFRAFAATLGPAELDGLDPVLREAAQVALDHLYSVSDACALAAVPLPATAPDLDTDVAEMRVDSEAILPFASAMAIADQIADPAEREKARQHITAQHGERVTAEADRKRQRIEHSG